MTAHVVLNATAYDGLPSGARSRAVCLAAAFLDHGARVTVFAPRGVRLAPLVGEELGRPPPQARFREQPSPFSSRTPLRRALESAAWLRQRVPADADLFLTDFYPVLAHVETALTVHDLRYLVAAEHESRLRCAWFRAGYARLARRAPLLVVPTAAVGRDAVHVLGVDPARVVLGPNALRRGWREAVAARAGADYVLAVGVGDRRKDLGVLFEAVRRLDARGEPLLPVVLAGRQCRRVERLLASAHDLVARGLIRHAGVVTDARLRELHARARALAHPSRYEGFGLTVIEALALGVPVLAARCAAVEEVAGGHARLLPPGDVEAWAAALRDVAATPPPDASRTEAARRHAASFCWSDTARALLERVGRAPRTESATLLTTVS